MTAGPEARVRALLERGRTLRSSKKPGEAGPLFLDAFELAHTAGLQALAADALHMLPLVESTLEGQLTWTHKLIDYARASTDAKARYWEAPGLNNLGNFLNDAGSHAEALVVLREALVLREGPGKAGPIRIAHWMIANTLRRMRRHGEALAIQLRLESELNAAGVTDHYVFEELTLLFEAMGDPSVRLTSARYRRRHAVGDWTETAGLAGTSRWLLFETEGEVAIADAVLREASNCSRRRSACCRATSSGR